eukprot:gene13266-biopygen7801
MDAGSLWEQYKLARDRVTGTASRILPQTAYGASAHSPQLRAAGSCPPPSLRCAHRCAAVPAATRGAGEGGDSASLGYASDATVGSEEQSDSEDVLKGERDDGDWGMCPCHSSPLRHQSAQS